MDAMLKIVLIGDTGVGKSSIAVRLAEGSFSGDIPHTIGADFKMASVTAGGQRVKLQIVDTAADDASYTTIASSFYDGADAVVIVYDVTNPDSFQHIPEWWTDVDRHEAPCSRRYIVGNKIDLEQSIVVGEADGRNYADMLHCKHFNTSASLGAGVEAMFAEIATDIVGAGAGAGAGMMRSSFSAAPAAGRASTSYGGAMGAADPAAGGPPTGKPGGYGSAPVSGAPSYGAPPGAGVSFGGGRAGGGAGTGLGNSAALNRYETGRSKNEMVSWGLQGFLFLMYILMLVAAIVVMDTGNVGGFQAGVFFQGLILMFLSVLLAYLEVMPWARFVKWAPFYFTHLGRGLTLLFFGLGLLYPSSNYLVATGVMLILMAVVFIALHFTSISFPHPVLIRLGKRAQPRL